MMTNTNSSSDSSPVHTFERAGLGKAPFRCVRFEQMTYQACQGAPIQPGAACDYCGTGISNVFWIRSADGREFKVGCDCVEKTGDRGLIDRTRTEIRALRREQRRSRQVARRETTRAARAAEREARAAAAREALLAEHPALLEALKTEHPIVADIADRFFRTGSLSEKQIALVFKLAREVAEREPEPEWQDVADGRRDITGKVLVVKVVDGYYGSELKMLVQTDTNEKLWSTVPAALRGWNEETGHPMELRGARIAFTAMVKRSDRDSKFGVCKRPTKARWL